MCVTQTKLTKEGKFSINNYVWTKDGEEGKGGEVKIMVHRCDLECG